MATASIFQLGFHCSLDASHHSVFDASNDVTTAAVDEQLEIHDDQESEVGFTECLTDSSPEVVMSPLISLESDGIFFGWFVVLLGDLG